MCLVQKHAHAPQWSGEGASAPGAAAAVPGVRCIRGDGRGRCRAAPRPGRALLRGGTAFLSVSVPRFCPCPYRGSVCVRTAVLSVSVPGFCLCPYRSSGRVGTGCASLQSLLGSGTLLCFAESLISTWDCWQCIYVPVLGVLEFGTILIARS